MRITLENIKIEAILHYNQCLRGFQKITEDQHIPLDDLSNKITKTALKTGLVALAIFIVTALVGYSAPTAILFTAIAGGLMFAHCCHREGDDFTIKGIKLIRSATDGIVNSNTFKEFTNWLNNKK